MFGALRPSVEKSGKAGLTQDLLLVIPAMGNFLSIGLESEKLASGSFEWKYSAAGMSGLPLVI
jgi:hypothetical protein